MNNLSHVQFTGQREPSKAELPATLRRKRAAALSPSTAISHESDGPPLHDLLRSILAQNCLPHDAYRPNAMERRLPAVQRRLRVSTVEAAQERLKNEPGLLTEALSVLLIGVTGFFRDRAVFDALRNHFLPELIAGQKPLRVLSAGSSRGHELYSIAMLLADAEAWEGCQLLGVDCRPEAIASARAGFFSNEDLDPVDAASRQRYFQPAGNGWEIRPWMRERMEWRVENILARVPEGPWDIVLYRNVGIYLEARYALSVWQRLCRNTRPGGLIVAGKADQPPPSLPLERVSTSIYRRVAA